MMMAEALRVKMKDGDVEKKGVVLAKEDQGDLPKVKWMVAASLLSSKNFSE
jgi:hypothetical protein